MYHTAVANVTTFRPRKRVNCKRWRVGGCYGETDNCRRAARIELWQFLRPETYTQGLDQPRPTMRRMDIGKMNPLPSPTLGTTLFLCENPRPWVWAGTGSRFDELLATC
jgi:hypothetical protein